MTTSNASASGKVILFGEHAVVYGRPAIAVPISQVRAHASVTDEPIHEDSPANVWIEAPDLKWHTTLLDAPIVDPLAQAVRLTLDHFGRTDEANLRLTVRAELPVARGMGSGAAVSTAIVRALAAHFEEAIDSDTVSQLVFEVERLYHGTPSGIDNSVIAFERPVCFVKGRPPETFSIHTPFSLIVADTGIPSSTRKVVRAVRKAWEAEPARYNRLFDAIGEVVTAGRAYIERGDLSGMGDLMDENHRLLQGMEVSSPELDRLVSVARVAGAMGAKLCGAGRGGNMIALVPPERLESVCDELRHAGAAGIITTVVQ